MNIIEMMFYENITNKEEFVGESSPETEFAVWKVSVKACESGSDLYVPASMESPGISVCPLVLEIPAVLCLFFLRSLR